MIYKFTLDPIRRSSRRSIFKVAESVNSCSRMYLSLSNLEKLHHESPAHLCLRFLCGSPVNWRLLLQMKSSQFLFASSRSVYKRIVFAHNTVQMIPPYIFKSLVGISASGIIQYVQLNMLSTLYVLLHTIWKRVFYSLSCNPYHLEEEPHYSVWPRGKVIGIMVVESCSYMIMITWGEYWNMKKAYIIPYICYRTRARWHL